MTIPLSFVVLPWGSRRAAGIAFAVPKRDLTEIASASKLLTAVYPFPEWPRQAGLLNGITVTVSLSTFWTTTLSPADNGNSLTARHSSPLTKTCPVDSCQYLTSPTFSNIPVSPQTDLLFRSLMNQIRGNTRCSTTSNNRNPITRIMMRLFTAASPHSTIRCPTIRIRINCDRLPSQQLAKREKPEPLWAS